MAGGQFDNAFKDLVKRNPAPLCRWLLGWPAERPLTPIELPTNLSAEPITCDGVFKIDESLIVHVEYQARASPANLHPRLVSYCSRLYLDHGRAPRQFAIVLFGGSRLPGRVVSEGLELRYTAYHLADTDPSAFLADPWLLPLAPLCRAASPSERIELVEIVADELNKVRDEDVRRVLAAHTATFANHYLDRSTLETILRRWTTMPLDLRELPIYQEGREEGREEGAAETLAAVLEQLLGGLGEGQRLRISALRGAALAQLTAAAVSLKTSAELEAWLETGSGRQ